MPSTLATPGLVGSGSAPEFKSGVDSSATPVKDGAAASQDRFLKLLVAQMNNQDPMNPMDNAQMTSQIAQINTVSGIQQLNETMKGMAAQIAALQTLQGSNLVGRQVLVEGNRLALDAATHSAVGAMALDSAASNVSIEVSTDSGKLIDTVALGPKSAGQHGFTLDSSAWPANTALRFKVLASNGAQPVASTALMRDTVTSVGNGGNGGGGLTLSLLGAGTLPYAGVRAVL